jgi:Fe-S-cluster containining protein
LVADPTTLAVDWWGKPCVFLGNGGQCRIYEVRPIDCRTYVSPVRCTLQNNRGVLRQRYRWERWANTMILEEEARQRGIPLERVGITPMLAWLDYEAQ